MSVPGTVSNCAHILREIGLENWAIGKTKASLIHIQYTIHGGGVFISGG